MNLLALALYAVFAVVAFGWRTWVQWRSTGDTGLRLHADRGSVQWWAKLAFIVAIAAGGVAPIDRTSVVEGKRVSGRVELGWRRMLKKQKRDTLNNERRKRIATIH